MGVSSGRVALFTSLLVAAAAGVAPGGGAGAETVGDGLDPTFADSGRLVITPPIGAAEYGNAVVALPDGGLLVAGTAVPDPDALPGFPEPIIPSLPETPTVAFPSVSRSLGSVFLLLRVTPDGRLDPDFGDGGRVWTDLVKAENPAVGDETPDEVPLGSSGGYTVAVQDDGKIIVAGTTATTTSTAFALARYLPDGTLDPSFDGDGLVVTDIDPLHSDSVSALLVGPHGRILAAGSSGERAALARYLPNGKPDRSFGVDGVVFTGQRFLHADSLSAAEDGRVVVVGQGGEFEGPYDFAVARYEPDGDLDSTFGGTGVVVTDLGGTGEGASGLTFGPDGTVVAAGNSSGAFAFARYHADGSLDPSFGKEGLVTAGGTATGATGAGRAFVATTDGRFVMAGGLFGAKDRDVAVARYLADGSRDTGFGTNGLLATDIGAGRDDEAYAAVAQPGGKLAVAGTSYKQEIDSPLVFLLRYELAEGASK